MEAIVETRIVPANAETLAEAARRLRAGGLVAFPTETVYGLGADAANGEAIARLYAAKGRPAFNPLIAHAADIGEARRLGVFNAAAEALAEAFWPGPLTLVLPKRAGCPVAELATAGLDTVAVRVPAHPVARDLLRAFGGPVVAPSANRSGHVSPTTAEHVRADLAERIDLIVDDGPTEIGLESTIVACVDDTPRLLRPGGVPREALESVVGFQLSAPVARAGNAPLSPGQLATHYAPRAQLRLDATDVQPGEALLAFGQPLFDARHALATQNLSARGNLIEAAANLFSHLRALDASGAEVIAAMTVPQSGLGEAINDRLRRAAAAPHRSTTLIPSG